MKNYQFIIVAVLLVAIAGGMVYTMTKKKPCACGDHDAAIEDGE